MITNGQVPLGASRWLTTRFASLVHPSLMFNPKPSNCATVVAAAGAALASHPSMLLTAIVPVINGAVVSCTGTVIWQVFWHPLFVTVSDNVKELLQRLPALTLTDEPFTDEDLEKIEKNYLLLRHVKGVNMKNTIKYFVIDINLIAV